MNKEHQRKLLIVIVFSMLYLILINALFPFLLNLNKLYGNQRIYDFFIYEPLKKEIIEYVRNPSKYDRMYQGYFTDQAKSLINKLDTNFYYHDTPILFFQVAPLKPVSYDLSRDIYKDSILTPETFGFASGMECDDKNLDYYFFSQDKKDARTERYYEIFGVEPLDEYFFDIFINDLRSDSNFFFRYVNDFVDVNFEFSKHYHHNEYKPIYRYISNWFKGFTLSGDSLYNHLERNKRLGDSIHYNIIGQNFKYINVKCENEFLFKQYYNSSFMSLNEIFKNLRDITIHEWESGNKIFKYFLNKYFIGYRYNFYSYFSDINGLNITNNYIITIKNQNEKVFVKRLFNEDFCFSLLYDYTGINRMILFRDNHYRHFKWPIDNITDKDISIKYVYYQRANILPLFLFLLLITITAKPFKNFRSLKFGKIHISLLAISLCFLTFLTILYALPYFFKNNPIFSYPGLFDKNLFNQLDISRIFWIEWLGSLRVQIFTQICCLILITSYVMFWHTFERRHQIPYTILVLIIYGYLVTVFNENFGYLDYYDLIILFSNSLIFIPLFFIDGAKETERKEKETLLLNKATQTAAVAISARNLSHITGSHVIPWLNAKLREWQETQPDITEYKKMEQVNRHIMERMDLIAEMSTAEPAFRTNMPMTEVVNYLQENTDAYTLYPGWFIKSLLKQNQKINLLTIPDQIDDYYWASPGDVFGKQAFSILIEGFIRNVVKHENPNEDIKIIFSITVPDANDMTINPNDYWCIDLVYNSENNRKDKEQFLNEIKETTGNTLIDNKTYNLEYTGWGLKEMLIAAAYLRMIPIVNIYSINEILNPNFYNIEGTIIKTLIPDNENGKLFGYRFFIYKSKFCNFYEIDNADSLTNRFANNGVSINDKANSNDYEYRIEILSKNSHGKKVINNSNQKVLFVNNTDEIKTLLESESYEKFSSDIGIKWNVEAKNSGYFQSMPTLIGYTNNNNESINYHILKKEDENAIAFFDNHGGFYKYLSNSCQNGKTAIESIKDRVFKDLKIREVGNYDFYYESYGSSSLTSNLILQKKYSILQESVCTKILIVDERIQDYVFNEKDNNTKIPLSEIFEGMNISVPSPKEFDLRIVQENLLDSIDKAYKLDDYHYIVIHMTIIEKNFRKTDKKALSSHITEEMNRYKGKVTLVITSGRGRPSNLPDDSFFIPYSTIQNYCLYSRSKAGLVKSLHSIRRKKYEKNSNNKR